MFELSIVCSKDLKALTDYLLTCCTENTLYTTVGNVGTEVYISDDVCSIADIKESDLTDFVSRVDYYSDMYGFNTVVFDNLTIDKLKVIDSCYLMSRTPMLIGVIVTSPTEIDYLWDLSRGNLLYVEAPLSSCT